MRLTITLLFLLSCTKPVHITHNTPVLTLETIRSVDFHKTYERDLISIFGAPDKRIALKDKLAGMETLIYFDKTKIPSRERLGILIDSTSKKVRIATWSVFETDLLKTKQQILNYFERNNFKSKVVGQISPDYYSNDTIYVDQSQGVSFYVNENSKEVESISFEEKKMD